MKNPNSYGGVSKLSGKRRRPYWVRLTTGWQTDLETGKVKQLTKTLGYYATRKEAMIALAAYHQNPIDLTKKDITFAEVWEIISPKYFEEHPKSSKALLPVYKRCEPLYNMVMCDLRTKHLQDVVDGMKGMSSQTKLRTVYKMIFKYCLENDILTKDYTAFVKFENNKADIKDKFFTKAEIVKVISAHDQSVASDGILLLLYTGMRIGNCSK